MKSKIGIIGGGVSGLVAAYLLRNRHDVTLFEANDYPGGHANTVRVRRGDKDWNVDTGFVVFNESAYPNFTTLLRRLGVESQPGEMSFSVQCEQSGLEYCSRSLATLLAQPANLLRPRFLRMLWDIRRFFRHAREVLHAGSDLTLGDYVAKRRYSRAFVDDHIIPMASAIWSTSSRKVESFPIRQFVRFFDNHGFLQVGNRSPWRTITGGSKQYVTALASTFADRMRLKTPVRRIRRFHDRVEVTTDRKTDRFDCVVVAAHSDQALAMLSDPSDLERRALSSIPYTQNDVILHTDRRLLPRRPRAWASWNYFKPNRPNGKPTATYWMNSLQALESPEPFCVTLNRADRIPEDMRIRRMRYDHPAYTGESFAAQALADRINGLNRTFFCGAYWGYGFHEDGVRSALRVGEHFNVRL